MKKRIKMIIICLFLVIMIYVCFIVYEVKRFENNIGISPLFTLKESEREVELIKVDGRKKYVEYVGFGYVFLYEYIIYDEFNEIDKSNVVALSGEFKLFNNIYLSMWIQ